MFTVNPISKNMDTKKKYMFHTKIDKELFICKRERPYIQRKVPFLCNIVKVPDEYNWKNLLRTIKYLQEKQDGYLTLKIDGMAMLDWWYDASFVVHADMKIHTRGVLTMDKVATQMISKNQKINTKISIEAELVSENGV